MKNINSTKNLHKCLSQISTRIVFQILFIGVFCGINFNVAFGQETKNCAEGDLIIWVTNQSIDGIFIVDFDETLIIYPGTNVEFTNPEAKLIIHGIVDANGTEAEPIVFWSELTDGWDGIEVTNACSADFTYCEFSDINRGVSTVGIDKINNGAMIVSLTDNTSFQNCRFFDNMGGIVVVNSSDLLISECFFEDNLIDGDFYGQIYFENSTDCQIKNNVFDGNKTNLDGIISLNNGSSAIVQKNEFKGTKYFHSENSFATKRGYPIIISYVEFNYDNFLVANNNKFYSSFGNGDQDTLREIVLYGNTYLDQSTALIWDNEFIGSPAPFNTTPKIALFAKGSTFSFSHNYVKWYNISSIEIDYCNATILENDFESNYTALGVIKIDPYQSYSGNDISVEISSNTFTNNRSVNGGAINSELISNSKCKTIVENNSFINNVAIPGSGGAIYANSAGYFYIHKNHFENNHAGVFGGAMHFQNSMSEVTIHDNVLKQNTAGLNGGGISVYHNIAAVEDSAFLISQNEFMDNSSVSYGGAISISSAPNLQHEFFKIIQNNLFENESEFKGGAIFLKNVGISANENLVESNKALYGGGFYCESLLSSEFIKNTVSSNTAIDGAGLNLKDFINLMSEVVFSDNVVKFNMYTQKGGGYYIENCNNTSFIRDLIGFNIKDIGATNPSGGGVYVNSSNLKYYNCNIISNSAATHNAAMYLDIDLNNTLAVQNCNITNHHYEGGLFFKNGITTNNISIYNTIFYGNDIKSIMYSYSFNNPIKTNNCYFDTRPESSNVIYLFDQVSLWPGWLDQNDYHLDCSSSICVDNGNVGTQYNDNSTVNPPPMVAPPSCGSIINDIGITGGPYAWESPNLLTPTQAEIFMPNFVAHIIDYKKKIVRIEENSIINFDLNTPIFCQWYFGDGYFSEPAEYDNNHEFEYEFKNNPERVTIIFKMQSGSDIHYYSQTVNFKKSQEQIDKPKTKLELENELSTLSVLNDDCFVVFPNPSSGIFDLRINNDSQEQICYNVFDIYGAIIQSRKFNWAGTEPHIINLTGKAKGIYFLKVNIGNRIHLRKIVLN